MEFLSSSRERVIDRFTNLPDDVACHILLFVSFKDSARVGCVSRRCKEFYLGVRNLDFDSAHAKYPWDRFRLLNCLDKFLLQRGEKEIWSFRIHWIFDRENNDEYFRIMSWISYAVKCNVGVLILRLNMFGAMILELPSCIFDCKSLKHLIVDILNEGGKVFKTPSLARSSNLQFLTLKNVAIQEEFDKWISKCCKSMKSLEVLSSVSRGRVLAVTGDIIKTVYRDGCRTLPLDNVCCFSALTVFGTLSDDLVPPMANLLKTMPNLISLRLYNAAISLNSRTNSSGFNISYWKSLNLAFVDHLQYASITIIFNGDNEVEFAAYLLENARNLKEMVIYHSGQPAAKSAIRWLQNKNVCHSTAKVFFMEPVKRN